ncbi:hypothetical protein TWF694_011169 [Orbilia ellipsospora]|uniref:F-box domain-containing protein n=1 Tax=Orbilia ellipsospora TaxID=2528407 RepID=A0AAV9X9D6_9PEZI
MASPALTISDNAHDPNDILNPSFIDLFIEEAPPQWSLEDLHHLSRLRNVAPPTPSHFQQLPVELIEHIACNLIHFRDIRALANSCTFFRKILFESSNHLFWYKWANAPQSMCRWHLGNFRQNRAYQNTIVNQQAGRRRKRCERCMARAIGGMAFKRKTCMDCWEDVGIPAHELFFLKQLDLSTVPREYVTNSYLPPGSADAWSLRREWDLLYFYKPGELDNQLSATDVQVSRESRSGNLIAYVKKFIRDMSGEIAQVKRTMGYRYSNYAYYNSGPNIKREKWYASSVDNLVCPAEVIQRMFELRVTEDLGDEWMERGEYRKLRSPTQLYGEDGEFCEAFPKVECDLQEDEGWLAEHGLDPGNVHECDMECKRKKRSAQFRKLWWPRAEKKFVDMFCGKDSVQLSEKEVAGLKALGYAWQYREQLQKVVDEILKGCKWVVPSVRGEWTEESLRKWERVHGKEDAD